MRLALIGFLFAVTLAFSAHGTCFYCDDNDPGCANDAACLGDCWCNYGTCEPN
jgi:hypothetical protein